MVIFMREERDAAKADRAEMEEKMEAKLGQQRAEMEATVAQLTAPQEAVSAEQIDALTARLEALHAARLLSDDELFAAEDCVADFLEVKGSVGVVTMDVVYANRAAGKAHKLVVLSEGVAKDAMFARQLRRKFV